MQTLKLHLGCGTNILDGYLNIDLPGRVSGHDPSTFFGYDLSSGVLPVDSESCSFIFSEHFLEHLYWYQAEDIIASCFDALIPGGSIRISVPDFGKACASYVDPANDYLLQFKSSLDQDSAYYSSMMTRPYQVLAEREFQNLPPVAHYNGSADSRRNLRDRSRLFNSKIDILSWVVYQFGEHKQIYDANSLISLLVRSGFTDVSEADFDSAIDSKAYLPGTTLRVTGKKPSI